MKKTAMLLIALLMLLIPTISTATWITYSGGGSFDDLTGNPYSISTVMQISNVVMTAGPVNQAVYLTPGVALPIGTYYLSINNWSLNISGVGSYSGQGGGISWGVDMWALPQSNEISAGFGMWGVGTPTNPDLIWADLNSVLNPGMFSISGSLSYGLLPHCFSLWPTFSGINGMPAGSGQIDISAVPEPPTLVLFGCGVVGLTWLVKRKRTSSSE